MEKTLFSGLLGVRLRVAEKTILAFFAALLIASLTLPLPGTTLGVLAVLNVMAGGLIVALSKDDLVERSRMASPIRDWLPALLMLLAYRESGLFIKADPAHRLDHLFILWEQTMLHSRSVEGLLYSCAPWLQRYLEMCYLLCYPLVPLGFAALYLTRPSITAQREPSRMLKNLSFRGVPRPRDHEESRKSLVSGARLLSRACRIGTTRLTDVFQRPARRGGLGGNLHHGRLHVEAMVDKFWTAVLLATLFCYAIYPFFPLTPPRVLFNDVPGLPVSPLLRHMNLWVLDRLSVQACVFPSAHAVAGACVGVVAFALSRRIHRL